MKKSHVVLLIILLIVFGNIVYLYPKLDFSPVPSQWAPGSGWGRYHIIQYGEIAENEHTLTWQSGIKNYATIDILPKILAAIVNIITGTTTFPDNERFHYIFPWVGILFLPSVVLYFYKYISNKEGGFNYFDCCLLYLFAMFPLTSTLYSMSMGLSAANSAARVLFLLLLVILTIIFVEKKQNATRTSIFLFMLIPFYYFHHTWSYYLAIYISAIAFFTFLKTNERYIASLSIFNIVIFFTSAMYSNHNLLREPTTIIRSFRNIVENYPSVSSVSQVNPELLGYRSFESMYSYLQLINCLLILLLCLFFIWIFFVLWKKGNHEPYGKMLLYFIMAQFFVGVALFAWEGVFGAFSRLFEVLVYVSMLTSSYLLVKCSGKLKFAIRLTLLCAICICVFSYLYYSSDLTWSMTSEEFKGISFTGDHITGDSNIFSDFRVATSLIFFGVNGIQTPEAEKHPPEITEEILERCYYNISSPEIILDKIMIKPNYYVITSLRQSETYIVDPSLKRFKPASKNFQDEWGKSMHFNRIYSSHYSNLFMRY